MGQLVIECDTASVSDGCNTFGELYSQRNHLFLALMCSHPNLSWKAHGIAGVCMSDDFFVAAIELPTGMITEVLPAYMWAVLDDAGVHTYPFAKNADGIDHEAFVSRLAQWCGLD